MCAGMFVDQGSSTFSLRMATTGACSAIHIMIKFTNLTKDNLISTDKDRKNAISSKYDKKSSDRCIFSQTLHRYVHP
jgi:ribulose-5-phosphate 4-epimerase/fuculose-1-phosphate aldolase